MKKNIKIDVANDNKKKNLKRLFAALIDWYIGSMVAGIPVMLIYSMESGEATIAKSLTSISFKWGIIAGVIAIIAALSYYVLIPTYVYNGQTLGKKLLGIKVTKLDDSSVNLGTVFRREFIGVMIVEGGIVSSSEYLRQMIGMVSNAEVYKILGALATIVTVTSMVMLVVRKENRMIHDFIGKTKVVEV